MDWYGSRRLLLNCLVVLMVAVFLWNRRGFKPDYVYSDGGPIIVLQAEAATLWQGSSGTMSCGGPETDFDAICRRSDHGEYGYLIKRYNSDILVMADSEDAAYAVTLPSGIVVIVQKFYDPEGDEINSVLARIAKLRPARTYPMEVRGKSLRLAVGADDGKGSLWGAKDVSIVPGKKQCDVYEDKGLVVLIRPALAG